MVELIIANVVQFFYYVHVKRKHSRRIVPLHETGTWLSRPQASSLVERDALWVMGLLLRGSLALWD